MKTGDWTALPDSARLYIFGASRSLIPSERDRLLREVDAFLEIWQAHRQDVAAARDWRYDRFLFVGADEEVTELSGCSIDTLLRNIRALESELNVRFIDGDAVFYRRGDEIVRTTRRDFADEVESGRIAADTIVFDNTVTRLDALRRGEWERPFATSWHARAFPRTSAAS